MQINKVTGDQNILPPDKNSKALDALTRVNEILKKVITLLPSHIQEETMTELLAQLKKGNLDQQQIDNALNGINFQPIDNPETTDFPPGSPVVVILQKLQGLIHEGDWQDIQTNTSSLIDDLKHSTGAQELERVWDTTNTQDVTHAIKEHNKAVRNLDVEHPDGNILLKILGARQEIVNRLQPLYHALEQMKNG